MHQVPAVARKTGLSVANGQVVVALLLLLAAHHVDFALHLLHLAAEGYLRMLLQLPFRIAPLQTSLQPLALYPGFDGIPAVIGVAGIALVVIVRQGHTAEPRHGLVPLAQAHILRAHQVVHCVLVHALLWFQGLFQRGGSLGLTVTDVLLKHVNPHGVNGCQIVA